MNPLQFNERQLPVALILWFIFSFFSLNGFAAETSLISVSSIGEQGNDHSLFTAKISGNGRFVAFDSYASNLVAGDINGARDMFVRDLLTHQTTLVSVNSVGLQAFGLDTAAAAPGINADGRFVVFQSAATNFVVGDNNGKMDIFVHDRIAHLTSRASVSSTGTQGNLDSFDPSISADGRFVAFTSDASNLVANDKNNLSDVFVFDRFTNQTTLVSLNSSGVQGNFDSYNAQLSADGRFVAFGSAASNLVINDSNNLADIFLHDRLLHTTKRISIASDGHQTNGNSYGHTLSANARYVAFTSYATNLVSNDTNGVSDIFIHDSLTGQTSRVSVTSAGEQISYGGVGFSSISADGRFITFETGVDLVLGDKNGLNDVYLHDQWTHKTSLVSVSNSGINGDNRSDSPSISSDGRFVAFGSYASNLIVGDKNNFNDFFVRDLAMDRTHKADLVISSTQMPASLKQKTQGNYQFSITNLGQDNIAMVQLNYVITNGSVLKLLTSQGACQRFSAIVLCKLGALAAGQSLTFQVTVAAQIYSANKTINPLVQSVTVSSSFFDPIPGNNMLKLSTPIIQ